MVAWHGNYAPYKYDLSKFMAINCVAFDHAVSIEYVDASKLQLLCIKPFLFVVVVMLVTQECIKG